MIIAPQQFIIKDSAPIINESFGANINTWEIVDTQDEEAYIKDHYYWMHNRTDAQWNYYKIKSSIEKHNSWLMYTEIQLLSMDEFGHYGLVWGFDQHREHLNRFTVSADRERALLLHFEKDHRRIFYRHQHNFKTDKTRSVISLMIVKAGDYLHFYIDDILIYISHQQHFANEGPYFGYYIEPGLFIRSNRFELYRLHLENRFGQGFTDLI